MKCPAFALLGSSGTNTNLTKLYHHYVFYVEMIVTLLEN